MDGGRHDQAHSSRAFLARVSLSGDRPSVSLGPGLALAAQLPPRGIPRLPRSRASPLAALCVRGIPGTASERITRLSLYSTLSWTLLYSLMVQGIPVVAHGGNSNVWPVQATFRSI